MGKRTLFTTITPLPANIPRRLAIDMLHNHTEMIELNPLVIAHHPIAAPKNAPADEFFAVWHEMTDRIQYVPGGTISSKVSYKGVFHDMPWGLQTHIYAPLGLEIRDKWQIRGNEPGEPREVQELGVKVPHDGLYLREDVDMTCNRLMTSFVRKTLEKAHAVLVERLLKKAELIDTGTLQAMFEGGRLKTLNPNNPLHRASMTPTSPRPTSSIPGSPQFAHPASPGFAHPSMIASDTMQSLQTSPRDGTFRQSYHDPNYANHPAFRTQDQSNDQIVHTPPPYQDQNQKGQYYNDLAKSSYSAQGQLHPNLGSSRQFAAELPGSIYHTSQHSPRPSMHEQGGSVTEGSTSPSTQKNFHTTSYGGSDRSSVTSEIRSSYTPQPLSIKNQQKDRNSMASELASPPPTQQSFQG